MLPVPNVAPEHSVVPKPGMKAGRALGEHPGCQKHERRGWKPGYDNAHGSEAYKTEPKGQEDVSKGPAGLGGEFALSAARLGVGHVPRVLDKNKPRKAETGSSGSSSDESGFAVAAPSVHDT